LELKDKIIVITGGGSGIGAAMARCFAKEAPAHIICADRNEDGARAVADEVGGTAVGVDIASEAGITALIEQVETEIGPIDLFVSNAGIGLDGGVETSEEGWAHIWDINVMAHIRAARLLVPKMLERGGGYLLNTASAAGLLAQIGSVSYSVTKHAAVSFAEWLSITHGKEGLKVSVLCPQGVDTPMVQAMEDNSSVAADGLLSAETVAENCLQAIKDEQFLILPHPEVADYMQFKAGNTQKWIGAMQKLQDQLSQK